MDSWERLEKPKPRWTIRLDADMLKWFRKPGPNDSRRINPVLRTYWMALMAGCIQAHDKDNTIVRLSLAARYLAEGKNMDGTEKE
ncbi:BrnA antitoxin family protein [Leisingera thetidis]|uniref:BrnA antitoxin family protein n=1 Tax=Leisingera thetidis TaxID=2930199 RepID=UPI0021F79186|nr:BrnA antitoxin family protein [Leisingera thetidis]